MVVAEDEDVRSESDRCRVRAERTERRERVVVAAAAHRGDVDGHRDVLAARAVVITETFGFLHDRHDVGEVGRLLPVRVRARQKRETGGDDAELHSAGCDASTRSTAVTSAGTCDGASSNRFVSARCTIDSKRIPNTPTEIAAACGLLAASASV